MKTLIVDDDPELVQMLQLVVELGGHAVLTAASGEQALRQWERERPDVVLLDIGMPDMDGYEVCQRLRQRDPRRATAIIMFTARAAEADKQRAMEVGADEYVTKPFSVKQLIGLLQTVPLRSEEPGGASSQFG